MFDMYREGYYGIIRIPDEVLLDILTGKATIDLLKDEDIRIIDIRENYVARSLDIVIYSDDEIEGVTYKVEVGSEVPLSKFTMKATNGSYTYIVKY